MAAKLSGGGDAPLTEINIVPFVDIVLVLLIIFMLTAPLMFDKSIPLELPTAASGESEPGSELGISILQDGSLLLNGEAITRDQLAERAKAVAANARALISADRGAVHGNVVDVIDTLREAGVEKYAINVMPDEK